jgi:hypothetical protein
MRPAPATSSDASLDPSRFSEAIMIGFKRLTLPKLLLATTMLASPLVVAALIPATAQVEVGITVAVAPPILPVYDQPPLPGAGYVWTPGYWLWTEAVGYYWVPGTWVEPPSLGVLWTPPYWGWANGAYVFHDGYWGPHVGFYGGVDYGYGYGGVGFQGGRWEGDRFAYNRTVNNFGSVKVTDFYAQPVTVSGNSHVSYAGGIGGIKSEPTPAERLAEHDHHVAATTEQAGHVAAAAKDPALAASHNNGHPAMAATPRAAQFEGPGVVQSRPAGAEEHAAAHGVASAPAGAPDAHPAKALPIPPKVAAQHPTPRAVDRAAAHPAVAAPAHAADGRPAPSKAASTPHEAPGRQAPVAKGGQPKSEL